MEHIQALQKFSRDSRAKGPTKAEVVQFLSTTSAVNVFASLLFFVHNRRHDETVTARHVLKLLLLNQAPEFQDDFSQLQKAVAKQLTEAESSRVTRTILLLYAELFASKDWNLAQKFSTFIVVAQGVVKALVSEDLDVADAAEQLIMKMAYAQPDGDDVRQETMYNGFVRLV